MSTFTKATRILSGTDDDIIEQMPLNVKRRREGWAYMLVFTSILGFFGSYHFILTMFIEHTSNRVDIPLSGHVIAFFIALFYSGGMALFTIDAMSSPNKFYAFLRMPISFIGSILIALPLTLAIFSDSIYQKIEENLHQKTQRYIEKNLKVDTTLNESIATLQQEINTLNTYKKNMINEASNFSQLAYNEEIGKGLGNTIAKCGTKCKKFQSQKLDALMKVSEIEKDLKEKYKRIDELRKQVSQENRTKTFVREQHTKNLNAIQSYDILTQMKILQEILQENPINLGVFLALILMLIILDLLPTISKIFTEKNEYDVLLSHRSKSNIGKLMAVFYANMNKISKGDTSINVVPLMSATVEK